MLERQITHGAFEAVKSAIQYTTSTLKERYTEEVYDKSLVNEAFELLNERMDFHLNESITNPVDENTKNIVCSPCNEDTQPCKCRARVFGSGDKRATGPQCSKKNIDGSLYCKKHTNEFNEHGKTDFGNYDEPRPDTSLIGGKHIAWCDTPKKQKKSSSSKKSTKKSSNNNNTDNDIIDLKNQYKSLLGKSPKGKKANDKEWLLEKIQEAKQAHINLDNDIVKNTVDSLVNTVCNDNTPNDDTPTPDTPAPNTPAHNTPAPDTPAPDDGKGTGLTKPSVNLFDPNCWNDEEEDEEDEEIEYEGVSYLWDTETFEVTDPETGKVIGMYNNSIMDFTESGKELHENNKE